MEFGLVQIFFSPEYAKDRKELSKLLPLVKRGAEISGAVSVIFALIGLYYGGILGSLSFIGFGFLGLLCYDVRVMARNMVPLSEASPTAGILSKIRACWSEEKCFSVLCNNTLVAGRLMPILLKRVKDY